MKMKEKSDSVQAKLDAMDDPEKLKVQLETLDAANKEMKEKIDAMPEMVKQEAQVRIDVLDSAKEFKVEGKLDEMSNLDIQKAVIAKVLPKFDMEGKSDDHIAVAYEMVLAQASSAKLDSAGSFLLACKKGDSSENKNIKARSDMKEQLMNNWKINEEK